MQVLVKKITDITPPPSPINTSYPGFTFNRTFKVKYPAFKVAPHYLPMMQLPINTLCEVSSIKDHLERVREFSPNQRELFSGWDATERKLPRNYAVITWGKTEFRGFDHSPKVFLSMPGSLMSELGYRMKGVAVRATKHATRLTSCCQGLP